MEMDPPHPIGYILKGGHYFWWGSDKKIGSWIFPGLY